jgi:hypothetical protein
MQQHPVIRTQFFTWSALAKASFTRAMSFLRRPLLALRIAADSLKYQTQLSESISRQKMLYCPAFSFLGAASPLLPHSQKTKCCASGMKEPMKRSLITISLSALLLSCSSAFGQAGSCSGMTAGQLTNLNGFVPFGSSSLWNTDISTAAVDPNSTNYINFIGATAAFHPDFGSGTLQNQTIGIPYQVVAGTQAKVTVKLGLYSDESDPGPEPIPHRMR